MSEQTLFNPRNVFISWNHKDRELKDTVCSFILETGCTVWESDLECAGCIAEACLGNIRYCDIFLVILTKHSVNSKWVQAELMEALKLPDALRRIVPLIVGDDAVKKAAKQFFSGISYIHISSAAELPAYKKKLLTKIEYLILERGFTHYRNALLHETMRIPFYYNGSQLIENSLDVSGLYISRKLHRISESSAEINMIPSEEKLLEYHETIVIIGESGSGKSRYVTHFAAAAGREESYLVFQINCGTFARAESDLTGYLYRQFLQKIDSRKYTAEHFYALLKRKEAYLTVIFDGMDEIIGDRSGLLQRAAEFSGKYPLARFIFTTRNLQDAKDIAVHGIEAKKFELKNFDADEAGEFIFRLFSALQGKEEEALFRSRLETVEEQIRSNPLLLGQLVMLYHATGAIPQSQVELFGLATEILVNDIDKEHDIFDGLTDSERNLVKYALPDLLKRLAYEKCLDHSESRLSENAEIVADILCEAYGYQSRQGDAKIAAKKVIEYLQRRYILAGDEFSHKMWLEYFAASWLYDTAYKRGRLVRPEVVRQYFADCYEDAYWGKITELFLCKADSRFVRSDGGPDRQACKELYDIVLEENNGEYGLLFYASKLLRCRDAVLRLLLQDIVRKTVQGRLPAYGQLFCYVPREKLYGLLLTIAVKLCESFCGKERLILLSLVRDVCYIYGGFVSSGQITDDQNILAGLAGFASGYGPSPRAALNSMFYGAGQPWLEEYISSHGQSRVYPFCFNVYAVSVCDGSGFGEYALDELFADELSLYQPAGWKPQGRYIGLVSVPYDREEMYRSFRPGTYQDMTGLVLLPSAESTFETSPVMLDKLQVLYIPGSIRHFAKYSLAGLGRDTDGVRISIAYGIVWGGYTQRIKRPGEREVIRIVNSQFEYTGLEYDSPVSSMFFPKSVRGTPDGLFMNNQAVAQFPLHGKDLKIGKAAFQNCKGLKTAAIPFGFTHISQSAFENCVNLTAVSIPDSVTSIGNNAFQNCSSLSSVIVPENVAEIGERVFENCSGLKEAVILGHRITAIGRSMFEGCEKLQIIRLPDTVRKFEKDALKGCRSLKTVFFGEQVFRAFYDSTRECPVLEADASVNREDYNKAWIASEKIKLELKIEDMMYGERAARLLEHITIPESATEIGACAFYGYMKLTDIHIPYGVTKIGHRAFLGCFGIKEIGIPDTVKEIADEAFICCANLESILLPDGIQEIGQGAFENCYSLRTAVLGKEIRTIAKATFANCYSLTSVILPDGITEIETGAFRNCWCLKAVTMPECLVKIGMTAFCGCESIVSVKIPEGVREIGRRAFMGCRKLEAVTLPEELTEIAEQTFADCVGLAGVTLPKSVKKIGKEAFARCRKLSAVTLPEGLTEIGDGAFDGCEGLLGINIPKSVKKIGKGAFKNCEVLGAVMLPEGLTKIEAEVFADCRSLRSIEIPERVKEIGKGAFENCERLSAAVLPEGITKIEAAVFADCRSLRDIEIPERVKEIGRSAFENCSELAAVAIPQDVAEIGKQAFSGCSSLAGAILPEGLTKIEAEVFADCRSLRSIEIPERVKEIGWEAFRNCAGLHEIVLPKGVTEIGAWAFKGCSSLTSAILPEGLTKIEAEVFADCRSLRSIEIPERVKEIGKRAFENCSELRKIVLPQGVTKIETEVFADCRSLRSIEIPERVKEIGWEAFRNCAGLHEIVLPKGVTEIGAGAFEGCSSLTSAILPEGLTEIWAAVFADCRSLRSIEIPERVKEIGWNAFENCSELHEIVLPKGVTKIGAGTFKGCSSLVRIALPEGITKIWEDTFADCTGLEEIVFPDALSEIEKGAFQNCSSLSAITLPESTEKICEKSFAGCTALQELYIPANIQVIVPDAFCGCRLSQVTIHRKFQGMLKVLFGNVAACMPHPSQREMIVAEFEC